MMNTRNSTASAERKISNLSPETRELVYKAVTAANEPVTVYEVIACVSKNTGRTYNHDTIRKALRDLTTVGRLFSRVETMTERRNRQGGATTQGQYSLLYWYKPNVIERISREAIPGISGVSASDYVSFTKSKRSAVLNALESITGMDGSSARVQTGNRIDRLEREVKTLREIVAAIVKTIG